MVKRIETVLLRVLQGVKIIDKYTKPNGFVKIEFDEELESADVLLLENMGWYLDDGFLIFDFETET